MGKAAALATLQRGGTVLLVGRTESKLDQAKGQLLDAPAELAVASLARELETVTISRSDDTENEEEHPIQWMELSFRQLARHHLDK